MSEKDVLEQMSEMLKEFLELKRPFLRDNDIGIFLVIHKDQDMIVGGNSCPVCAIAAATEWAIANAVPHDNSLHDSYEGEMVH